MSADEFAPALSTGVEEYAEKTPPQDVSGMCTACGAIEVTLVKATGVRDFSAIGESSTYPTGYGCELCS